MEWVEDFAGLRNGMRAVIATARMFNAQSTKWIASVSASRQGEGGSSFAFSAFEKRDNEEE